MKPGAICYLVKATRPDVADFIKSLLHLRQNYLVRFPADVIAFHEADLSTEQRREILDRTGMKVMFSQVIFSSADAERYGASFPLGYRHMCHFFANDIFTRPELDNYEYYCRLDTDSFILSPVRRDIFEAAKQQGAVYGYIAEMFGSAKFMEGLWPLCAQYVARSKTPVLRGLYTDIKEGWIYYTNFELCRLDWFRRDPWKSFFAEIDRDGGIYRCRWGDHLIRYIGVNLYVPADKILKVTDIHYRHHWTFNAPR